MSLLLAGAVVGASTTALALVLLSLMIGIHRQEHAASLTHRPASLSAALARRIDVAVSEPVGIGRRNVTVGISIGVALHPSQARAPDELVRLADADMYRDKRDRRAAGSRQVA